MEGAVPIEEERRIRILIVPVGNMSPEKFDKYSTMLKEFSRTSLANLKFKPEQGAGVL
jgi:hypothetical protein